MLMPKFEWLANFAGCPNLQAPVVYAKIGHGSNDILIEIMGMTEWGADEDVIGFRYVVE